MRHPIQSPGYWGRYARTMEDAFGQGARLSVEHDEPPICKYDVIGWVAVVVFCVFVVITGLMK